ncbi:MAG: Brp/Blh family beta-carotene 15,15'-dioxygenase [Leeuwenhoekiella sp.]
MSTSTAILIEEKNSPFRKLVILNIITGIALGLNFITPFFTEDSDILLYACILLIISAGLLHGCNDLDNFFSKEFSKRSLKSFVIYIMLFLFAAGALYLFPNWGIYAFIVLSGYHFGQQDLENELDNTGYWPIVFKCSFGLAVLLLMLYLNIDQVNIFLETYLDIVLLTTVLEVLLFSTLALQLISGIISWSKNDQLGATFVNLQVALVLFFFFFQSANLLWSFTFYFIVWHSLPSLRHQVSEHYGEVSQTAIKAYLKEAMVWYILSMIGISILAFMAFNYNVEKLVLSVIFAATVPHMIIHLKTLHLKDRLF